MLRPTPPGEIRVWPGLLVAGTSGAEVRATTSMFVPPTTTTHCLTPQILTEEAAQISSSTYDGLATRSPASVSGTEVSASSTITSDQSPVASWISPTTNGPTAASA